MRKSLPVVLVLSLLVVIFVCITRIGAIPGVAANSLSEAQLEQTLIAKSKEVWEAYKGRNTAAIKALTAEDYGSFTLAGPSNLQQDIATIDKLTIENYTLEDPKVSKTTKDVAILRYKCDLKGSFEGKTFKPVYSTEVWVNRGGKWLITSYSETPIN